MAHASVASLVRTIESLLTSNSPMQSITCDHKDEICTLHEKMISLEVFLKNYEKTNISKEMTDVEVHIKKVANIEEQTIQLRVTEVASADDENLRRNLCERLSCSLQQAEKDIDRRFDIFQWFNKTSKEYISVEKIMVGRDDKRERLLNDVTTGFSGEPKVIPIVGKGGIGKTTLAKEVYNDACIRSHFDVCAWATVSQQLDVKEILLSLLHSIRDDKVFTSSEAKLADMLQKSLKEYRSLQMGFMDQDESWNLFKSATFANEALPYEFKTVGKQITAQCHGVPLTIVETKLMVAGLLKSKKAIEDWESVAKDVNSFVTNDPGERCSRVIGLSYNHLTSILKTCLLYFGIFLEDTEIPAKHFYKVRIFSFPLQIPSFIWLRYLALRFLRNPDSFPLQIPPEICSNLIIPSAKAFPGTLKKLKLKRTCLSWSYLNMIAEFPSLEVLKLMSNACHGREWYPNVREFTRLKLFLIEDDHLKYWKDTDDNFLILERIVLSHCCIISMEPMTSTSPTLGNDVTSAIFAHLDTISQYLAMENERYNVLFEDSLNSPNERSGASDVDGTACLGGYSLYANPLWCDNIPPQDGNLFLENERTLKGRECEVLERNSQSGEDELELLECLANPKYDCSCSNVFVFNLFAAHDDLYLWGDYSFERESVACLEILSTSSSCVCYVEHTNDDEPEISKYLKKDTMVKVDLCDTFLYPLCAHDIFHRDIEGMPNFEYDTLGESESGRDLSPWLIHPFDPGTILGWERITLGLFSFCLDACLSHFL
ncbi:hypothetical protein BC332_24384 [Capsicum chinense]|nr:hypothetical protein BC332_24384 [Capsicum chinense]